MPVTGNVNGLAIMQDNRLVDVDSELADAMRYRLLRRAARNGALEFVVAVSQIDHCLTDGCIGSGVDEAVNLWPECFHTKKEE